MKIVFTRESWEEYQIIASQDQKKVTKINRCLESIRRDGSLNGEGKPERLKYREGYSRRIDEKNRLVYTVDQDSITILSCYGHYED